MDKWEYKTVSYESTNVGGPPEEELNKMGAQGWEVVSSEGTFVPESGPIVGGKYAGLRMGHYLYRVVFKRRKP